MLVLFWRQRVAARSRESLFRRIFFESAKTVKRLLCELTRD